MRYIVIMKCFTIVLMFMRNMTDKHKNSTSFFVAYYYKYSKLFLSYEQISKVIDVNKVRYSTTLVCHASVFGFFLQSFKQKRKTFYLFFILLQQRRDK